MFEQQKKLCIQAKVSPDKDTLIQAVNESVDKTLESKNEGIAQTFVQDLLIY